MAQSSSPGKIQSRGSFLEGELNLIHIPLELYSVFLQPILRVLLPQSESLSNGSLESGVNRLTFDDKQGFLNVSVTPVECSVVCSTFWVKHVFEPHIKTLSKESAKTVSISKDTFIVLELISTEDVGSQVVNLSSPLALAGIPILFITTYWSDFILVPSKDRKRVMRALLVRGFQFRDESAPVPGTPSHSRGGSSGETPTTTPPPINDAELQERTFELLKRRNVVPHIDPELQLIRCSGAAAESRNTSSGQRPSIVRTNTGNPEHQGWVETVNTKMYTCLVSVLACQPKFLSITLAPGDLPSFLIDKTLVRLFGDSLMLESNNPRDLTPIFLDLVNLPFEATGIVSGVAGKLVSELRVSNGEDPLRSSEHSEAPELTYLSTSKAGTVILPWEHSQKALDILMPLLPQG